jgi:hypothetical protein
MWAGSGGVWAIGVRVGSGESGRRSGGGALGGLPAGAVDAPGVRLPRALRALEPGAGRVGAPLGGSVGGW